ncbi:GntR family transcriptional regulator [Acinetobacter rathckeae]|uniref:GntR family transcriptional regulator n=1 Tax=Acinetobacter rathckeae TaxID=2605272 RepID=UPI0018A279B8|nr:GntR family transcriptional regulator [Acinetobacter rathckeae]MBF7696379.1 GntR family transcriptional regulator [Acinetobacter rathckeae]
MSATLKSAPNLGEIPSSSEVILKFLRDAVIRGEFLDNEPIRQDEIAKSFNVSKIPVREALKRLEAEGLVQFHRNKGATVTRMSDFELAQIFEIRVILEVQAIQMAIPHLTEDDFARAEAILDEFIHLDDPSRTAELNWAFHKSLYDGSQRPVLVNMIRSIYDKIERYLRLQMEHSVDAKAIADREHRAILQACRAKDTALAAQLVEQHIHQVCDQLLHLLPKNSDLL